MRPAPKRIAYITFNDFSGINLSVLRALRRHFPDFAVDHLHVRDHLLSRKGALLVNVFHTVAEYGPMLLRRQRTFKWCFLRTGYLFRSIQRFVRERLSKEEYAFSLQTQSFFDAGAPGLPHFVYTDHTHLTRRYYPDYSESDAVPECFVRLETAIYRNAAAVFTMSTHVARSLREHYRIDEERVACVFAGSNAEIVEDGIDDKRFEAKNVLFVGRHWERKGGPQLAAAFRRVLEAHPEARLTIVGCTPRLDLPNCEMAGVVPRDRVHRYFQKASVFCLPARFEPFGIVFVEAMEYRLPIVATHLGAALDFLEDGESGFRVEVDDVEGLAEALIALLDDPEECRRMGERGYRAARERYNWESVGARIREGVLSAIEP